MAIREWDLDEMRAALMYDGHGSLGGASIALYILYSFECLIRCCTVIVECRMCHVRFVRDNVLE